VSSLHQLLNMNLFFYKVEREIQRVTASNFNTGSSTNEKQEVTIEENSGSISDATYQLGLYGVYTSKFLKFS
jgi:hypothetical protein